MTLCVSAWVCMLWGPSSHYQLLSRVEAGHLMSLWLWSATIKVYDYLHTMAHINRKRVVLVPAFVLTIRKWACCSSVKAIMSGVCRKPMLTAWDVLMMPATGIRSMKSKESQDAFQLWWSWLPVGLRKKLKWLWPLHLLVLNWMDTKASQKRKTEGNIWYWNLIMENSISKRWPYTALLHP
jgi:hypothetical protein